MCILQVAVAILLALYVIPKIEATRACCYPVQMEGVKDLLETRKSVYFAADYHKGIIFETEEIKGENYQVFDLRHRKMYTVRGETCSERALIRPDLFNPCLEEEDKVKSVAFLGTGGQNISVDTFEYDVKGIPVFRAVTRDNEECFPVSMQTRVGRKSVTTMFYNVRSGISHPFVFDQLTTCTESSSSSSEEGQGRGESKEGIESTESDESDESAGSSSSEESEEV